MPRVAWVENALSSASKVRILGLLSRWPDRVFSEAEIARQIKMSPNTVNLSLADLKASGIVRAFGRGRGETVQFLPDAIFGDHLMSLFKSEDGLAETLMSTMAVAAPDDVACVLFGSVARGDATRESDIDLLVVARSHDAGAEAARLIARAGRQVCKAKFNILIFTPSEVRKRWSSPLFRSIRDDGRNVTKTRLEDLV